MSISEQLAAFAAGLSLDQVPDEVTERTKLLLLDTSGIAIRARHDAESTPATIRMVERLGGATGNHAVFGDQKGYGASAAALINGALAHSLDFDDTHAAGSIHSSAPIIPAALTAAEMTGASGSDVLAGIIAGYEIQIRLSLALSPKDHYDRGYHPTATCGAFGAAAAAGRVLGLNDEQMLDAFGICLSQTSGTIHFVESGAWTKRYQIGHAAMNGLIAATLAQEGYLGARTPIEGKHGFLNSFAPNPDPSKAVAGLGTVWETLALAVKPYPTCRYSHAAMEAIASICTEQDLTASDVEAVYVGLPQTGFKIIGDGLAHKQQPKSVVDGQFSMPFCAAVAIRERGMGWDDYAKHLKDSETLSLCKKVDVQIDPKPEASFPRFMSGIARVTAKGKTTERFVEIPKGEPENFQTAEELREKFDGLTAPYLSQAQRDQFVAATLSFEKQADVAAYLAMTRSAGAGLASAAE
ncbi:MmgE/PrpD family protein [Alphaproteobacteria bacterium HT1-32]|nr:MmgE/PrpD family protein [Alphaproteobacteria bacterium HT1-32]